MVDTEGAFVTRWPHVWVFIAAMGGIAAVGVYLLGARIDDTTKQVALLSTAFQEAGAAASSRFDGKDAEDTSLRESIDGLRADLGRLGDRIVEANGRIVESNDAVGKRIDQLRSELTTAISESTRRMDERFDALDKRLDTIPGRIDFDTILVPKGMGMLTVSEKGELLTLEGKPLGALPAIVRWGSE